MLVRDEIERAVRLQACGYQLLRWLEKAFSDGFIRPEAAGAYATSEEAAYSWLDKHYVNLPENARPARPELRAFSNLFWTYLESSFDLDANPGERLYSPDAHCFCPICSWMVRRPHLRPKTVGGGDKKVAERMKRGFILRLAAARGMGGAEQVADDIMGDPTFREPVGLCTYAADLLDRLEGRVVGAASLALWRSFAWTPQGSRKKNFTLTADAIMAAQDTLSGRLGVQLRDSN
jgi:hypothetical protein